MEKNNTHTVSYMFKNVWGKSYVLSFIMASLLGISNIQAQCLSAINPPSLVDGVNYNYYEGSWNSLPDFNAMVPVSSGLTSNFNLSNAQVSDNYGFTFDGYINVTSNGTYTFYTSSDDGSALFIDGAQIVDNDGLHGVEEQSGQICLDAGYHQIRVEFFEKTGGNVLSVSYEGPGFSKTILSSVFAASSVENLALNGTASQSSTDHNGIETRAIDGNTSGVWNQGSVTHTETEDNPWWEVNIGTEQSLENIVIYNRIDNCCSSRLTNFTVSVINGDGNTTFSQSFNSSPSPSIDIDVNGVSGLIVRVQLDELNTPLSLAEVEVYGSAGVVDMNDECNNTTALIEAECFDDMNGVQVQTNGNSGGENIGHIENGDWTRYNNINLSNVNTVNLTVATIKNGSGIEVRLGSITGTLIADVDVPNTGNWLNFTDISAEISNVSGNQDIFLVFKGGSGGLLNIDSFGFTEEDISEPQGDCTDLYNNVSISHTNPTCSNNNGTIVVNFPNLSEYTQIQISVNAGNSYPITVNDNVGSHTITGLGNGSYEVALRYVNGDCEYNAGHLFLVQDCGEINLTPRGVSWHDSYEANGRCWCSTNFDHDLDEVEQTINGNDYNVVDICDELESHPLFRERENSDKIYNDVQCGNGPVNTSADEPLCPGRVDIGVGGCLETGAHWDMAWLASRTRFSGNSSRTAFNSIATSLVVYPTNAKEEIIIEGLESADKVQIFNIEGDLILDTYYFGNVNVASLPNGVYVVRSNNKSARFTKE